MGWLVLAAAAAIGAALGARARVLRRASARNAAQLSQFELLPDLGCYREALPRVNLGGEPWLEHAVLLLHGYASGPPDLGALVAELDRRSVPYYLPLLTGFGRRGTEILAAVGPGDWVRDAIAAYDLLRAGAKRISVVGHSTGATLAAILAARRPIEQLVLIGANLKSPHQDQARRWAMRAPVLGGLGRFFLPMLTKPTRPGRTSPCDTIDPDMVRTAFHYICIPWGSVRALWDLQDMVDVGHIRAGSIALVWGEQDGSVDTAAAPELLAAAGIPFSQHPFANSAHNVLEDYDRVEAARLIVDILQAGAPAEAAASGR